MRNNLYRIFNKLINNDKSTNTDVSEMAYYLKKSRKEKMMTLAEVSEGICSLSYLSKVERNKIDVNKTIYNRLLSKMDVVEYTPTSILDIDFEELAKNIMNGTNNNKYDAVNLNMTTKNIITSSKNLLENNYLDFEMNADNLLESIQYLNNKQYKYLLFMFAYFFYNKGLYYYTFSIGEIIDDKDDTIIDLLIRYHMLLSAYYLQNIEFILTNQETVCGKLYQYEMFNFVHLIYFFQIERLAPSMKIEEVVKLDRKYPNLTKQQMNHLLNLNLFINGEKKKLYLGEIEKNVEISNIIVLRLLCYSYCDDKKSINELYGNIKVNDINTEALLKYLYIKHNYNGIELIDKIKALLIQEELFVHNVFVVKYLQYDLINIFTAQFRYKESITYFLELEEHLKSLKKKKIF